MLHKVMEITHGVNPMKFNEKYGEGTRWDLDYGKLVILGLCIYIAIKVS